MGSRGAKPRKGKRTRHLDKVGTSTENQRLLHEEQEAVLANVGLGGRGTWVKVTAAVVVVFVLAALVSLIFWY
jgi:hypothetical protein